MRAAPHSVTEEFIAPAPVPETVPDLLNALVLLGRSGEFSHWEFYRPETMGRLFGSHITAELSDDGIRTTVSGHGYVELVAAPDETTARLGYLAGVWISATKPNANGWPFCCRLDVEFWGETPGLDFKSVTNVLGPDWREDHQAEFQNSISRSEPFNPPAGPKMGYMADAMITYPSAPGARLELTFNSSGSLHALYAEWPKSEGDEKHP